MEACGFTPEPPPSAGQSFQRFQEGMKLNQVGDGFPRLGRKVSFPVEAQPEAPGAGVNRGLHVELAIADHPVLPGGNPKLAARQQSEAPLGQGAFWATSSSNRQRMRSAASRSRGGSAAMLSRIGAPASLASWSGHWPAQEAIGV